jgi:hypothetical protein
LTFSGAERTIKLFRAPGGVVMVDETTEEPDWVRSVRQSGTLIDRDGGFDLSEPVSLYTFANDPDSPWLLTERPLVPAGPPKHCSFFAAQEGAFVAVGVGRTDGNGRHEYLLSDFFCQSVTPVFFRPTTLLLATAAVDQPVFMTTQSHVVSAGQDLRLRFYSWRVPGGHAAPAVSFRWHLTAAAYHAQ